MGKRGTRFVLGVVVGCALALAVTAAGCGGGTSGPSASSQAVTAPEGVTVPSGEVPGKSIEKPGQCGAPDAQGQKATGEPIKLGAIITKQPGVDFTPISDIAKAYFACVNDNGGIHGRPIEYVVEEEQTDPQQVAQLAVKLIENEKVLGLVGSTSLIDCTVNHKYYEQKGFYVIEAGVPAECFTTPNMAPVNMGPRISMIGIADYMARHGAKKLVVVASNNPGVEYYNDGVLAYAKAKGIPAQALTENVPIQDATSVVQQLVQAAGPGGAVLLDFTAPEAIKILQAASQQGLIDQVMWGCGGSCNDESLAKAVGPEWNGKFPVNAELGIISNGEDNLLYQKITRQYAPNVPLGSFGQLGYMAARYATEALLSIPEGTPINAQTVNEAFKSLKDVRMDIVCKPWYFGDLPFHQPVNTGRTLNLKDGQFVQVEGCRDIPAVDSALRQTRAAEKAQGLNS